MKIGILGTGDVGRTLAGGFAALGHEVVIGTREPGAEKVKALLEQIGAGVRAASFAEAAQFGEVIVLAIGGVNVENAIRLAGAEHFAGKLVIDATNPLRFDAPGQPPVLTVGHSDSGGEQTQRWLPAARVVKAFNIVGHPHMVAPDFNGDKPDMFICGNDAQAKQVVDGLIRALGWPASIDLGDITKARYLEPLAMVWITHLFNNGFNPNHAFKLLHK
ncbi:MAG: NAD(P)-binding domain-containing protein [Gammaproteobacteria bacterium]|nr:NAD(P)-binding domain-containing protein [Gammaproteobacteria bacterium]